MDKNTLLLGCLLVVIPCGCYKAPQLPPAIVPQVEVAQVESRDVTLYTFVTGYTEASHSVNVEARVGGSLQEVYFTEAAIVEKDAPLFLIEQQNYQAMYNAKLANLEVLKAKVQLTEANLARAKRLVEQNTISAQEYQTSFAENEQAKAAVLAGEAEANIAKINLDYTTISAPIRGMISRKTVDVGNVVGPGSGKLTTINSLNPLYVYYDLTDIQFNVMMNYLADRNADAPEPKTAPLLEGSEPLPFEMALAGDRTDKGLPIYKYKGVINYIDNTIGRDVGKITFRGEVANPDYRIFPGQICSIRIPYAVVENALVVRENAILTDLSDKYVLIVDDENNVSRRIVQFGDLVDAEHRIVLNGLRAGEKYIVNGMQKAKVGKPVRY
jgi:multidrug efflux system membrane fusion protein